VSPCDGIFAARGDGDMGVRLSVRNIGGLDGLVADGERCGALRRGVKPGIARGEIAGAVEGGGVEKAFEGYTSGTCAGISPPKVADGLS